ncbi:MAG: TonB-dependent receptor [Betaproteobacteria bacterium]
MSHPSCCPAAARAAMPFVLASVAIACSDSGLAQGTSPPDPQRLDPLSVTATRGLKPAPELLADVTVIGRDEIARSGVQSLAELLQRQPGSEIVQNGGPGSVSGVFLRGANTQQTLVLVDGVRLASATTGATTLAAIPLDQVERIEILRGPASSLYGADAIGGVIQVFTRRGSQDFSANASAGYGTYSTSTVTGGVSGSAGPLRLSVQAGGTNSAGFNAVVNPSNFLYNDDRDGYRSKNVSAYAALPWADGQELTAQYFWNWLNAQYDGGPGADDRTITTVDTWLVASRNRLASFWVSQLSTGTGTDDSVSQTGFGDFPFKTTQRQYTWQNELTLPLGLLTAGLERREERVATNEDFAVTARNTNSVFGIYQLRYKDASLQANLRHDDSSQYGGKTTGAAAIGYQFAPSFRMTAGGSTGFKPPTFNDLYFPNFSDPTLRPETSHNAEIGAYLYGAALGGTWEARAIAYRNKVSQLIVLQCDEHFNCLPQNVASALLVGVTLGLDVRFGATTIAASLDLSNPEDQTTGLVLPRRARQHGAVTLGHTIGTVRLGVEVVASSYRYDNITNTRRLAGYGILNLTAEWEMAKGWTVFARANNVFDQDYQLAADFSTGGATVFAGLRWRP